MLYLVELRQRPDQQAVKIPNISRFVRDARDLGDEIPKNALRTAANLPSEHDRARQRPGARSGAVNSCGQAGGRAGSGVSSYRAAPAAARGSIRKTIIFRDTGGRRPVRFAGWSGEPGCGQSLIGVPTVPSVGTRGDRFVPVHGAQGTPAIPRDGFPDELNMAIDEQNIGSSGM